MRVQRDSPVREKIKLGVMNGSLPLSSKPGFSDPDLEPDLEVRRLVQQSLPLAAWAVSKDSRMWMAGLTYHQTPM